MDTQVKISEDKDLVQEIRRQLKANGGYCPCRLEQTPDTKCMCKEFRDQIKQGILGPCHCGLYELTNK